MECRIDHIELCGKKDCKICFERSFASYEGKTKNDKLKVDCWDIINKKKPLEIYKNTNKKFWFKCDICSHIFEKSINKLVNSNSWCPYCSKNKICYEEKCDFCYNMSFASYKGKTEKGNLKIDCWDIANKLKPREIFKSSGYSFCFKCDICYHKFEKKIDKIINNWCPYCATPSKKICYEENCKLCFEKSFASCKNITKKKNLKVNCWDITNKLKPREVFKSCNKKFCFKCDICYHKFNISLGSLNRNRWCPYCSKPLKKLCCKEDCNYCFNKSFASFKGITNKGNLKINCWDITNNLTPREVSKGNSSNKFIFKCDICFHKFKSILCNISCGNNWCPFCINKTEGKLKYHIKIKYPKYKLIHQPRYEWCKNIKNNFLPFDFVIEELKIIIEIDGEQHFSQVLNWNSPEENLKNDIFKMKLAKENGYTIIRILQQDIWDDKNDWENKLEKVLIKYDEPTCFFIGCEKKYINYLN